MDAIQSFDEAMLLFIQNHIRCDFLTPIMKAASWLGDCGKVWILLAVILLLFNRTRRAGFDLGVCILLPWSISELLLKNLIGRVRPYLVVDGLELIVRPLSSFSFPSGHACASFAAATALTRIYGKKGAWTFLPATIIALSRPYVGIHYFTDILVGALAGGLGAMLAYWLSHKFIKSGMVINRKNG